MCTIINVVELLQVTGKETPNVDGKQQLFNCLKVMKIFSKKLTLQKQDDDAIVGA